MPALAGGRQRCRGGRRHENAFCESRDAVVVLSSFQIQRRGKQLGASSRSTRRRRFVTGGLRMRRLDSMQSISAEGTAKMTAHFAEVFMNRRLVIVLVLSSVFIATTAFADWTMCIGGSFTCTTAKVGVGFTAPSYPISVSSAAAIAGGGISTGGEGNFNVAFASGNAFIGQAATTGAVVFGQGQGGGNILFTVWNGATNLELMRILSNGRVGIGTATPSAMLDINGGINVTGNIAAKYQDIAEWVPSDRDLASGSVVVLSDDQPNHVEQSLKAYDTKVAGIISERPGMILGEASAEKS